MSKEKSMILSSTQSHETVIKADYVTADTIGISYTNLPGCQPNSNGHFVAIWQNTNSIPWNTPPLKTQPIDTNTPAGSMNFTGLTVTKDTYIIGYSVGPTLSVGQKYGNICSSVYIPDTTSSDQIDFASGLSLIHVGSTSVAFGYKLPDNITPQSNKAWCGLWRAGQPSYNNPPDYVIPANLDAASGTLAFNNVKIGIGLTYTIAFFMSGYDESDKSQSNQKAMACSITFTN
ncbi:hypothetical protein [Sinomicrobium sp. M5D2P9]